jgi:predicted Zn-dependent protease
MEAANRLQLVQEMLKKDPNDAFLLYALAIEIVNSGDKKEGIRQLEKLRLSQPDYLATYYQLGKLYEELSQNEKAIPVYKEGLEIAKKQNNNKTYGEISEALWLIEEE